MYGLRPTVSHHLLHGWLGIHGDEAEGSVGLNPGPVQPVVRQRPACRKRPASCIAGELDMFTLDQGFGDVLRRALGRDGMRPTVAELLQSLRGERVSDVTMRSWLWAEYGKHPVSIAEAGAELRYWVRRHYALHNSLPGRRTVMVGMANDFGLQFSAQPLRTYLVREERVLALFS